MEAATVSGLVAALVETFADGQADYETWKQKRVANNHYRGRGQTSPPCALSTTLSIAGAQIQATYDKAISICGHNFTMNDFNCRSMLWSQLNVLSDRVAGLHRAAAKTHNAMVDLADATQVCEDVRRASLQALVEQCQRAVSGRPSPKGLGLPRGAIKPRPSGQSDETFLSPRLLQQQQPQYTPQPQHLSPPRYQVSLRHQQHHRQQNQPQSYQSQQYQPQQYQLQQYQLQQHQHSYPSPPSESGDDRMSAKFSEPLWQQEDPPSPPLTPKISAHSPKSSMSTMSASRPVNSVFAQFCPEAMALQVNPKKVVPGEPCCPCGYGWRAHLQDKRDVMPLKEGFKLTQRFLAKSHLGPVGFGCVLCTSTGKSDRFDSVDQLREHINENHTKWQLLHDSDCRASSKLADGLW